MTEIFIKKCDMFTASTSVWGLTVTVVGPIEGYEATWNIGLYDSEGDELEFFTLDVPEEVSSEVVKTKLLDLLEMISNSHTKEHFLSSFFAVGAFCDIEQDSLDDFIFEEHEEESKCVFRSVSGKFIAVPPGCGNNITICKSEDFMFTDLLFEHLQKAPKKGFFKKLWYKTFGVVSLTLKTFKTCKCLPEFELFKTSTKHIDF